MDVSLLTSEEKVQGSMDWHLKRQKCIGGSDAAAILGVSPWKTAYQLWLEKVGPLKIKPPNEPQKRGLDLEPAARHWFMDHTYYETQPEVRMHPKYPWMIASFDGMTKDGKIAVEVKCPGKKDHESARQGIVPIHYAPQLNHLLAVSGLDMIYYLSFDGEDGYLLEFQRNEKDIEDLISKELKFFGCMRTLLPPELTSKDVIHRFDEEWKTVAEEYKAAKHVLKWFESREEELRDRLIELANDSCSEGAGIKLTKYAKIGPVQYSVIPELKEIDLSKYRKQTTTCWRIGEV